jgi:hypothetical protein
MRCSEPFRGGGGVMVWLEEVHAGDSFIIDVS